MSAVAAPEFKSTTTLWNIDPVHSNAQFKVKHMMISNVKGEFTSVKGSLQFDEKNLATFAHYTRTYIDCASRRCRCRYGCPAR